MEGAYAELFFKQLGTLWANTLYVFQDRKRFTHAGATGKHRRQTQFAYARLQHPARTAEPKAKLIHTNSGTL